MLCGALGQSTGTLVRIWRGKRQLKPMVSSMKYFLSGIRSAPRQPQIMQGTCTTMLNGWPTIYEKYEHEDNRRMERCRENGTLQGNDNMFEISIYIIYMYIDLVPSANNNSL